MSQRSDGYRGGIQAGARAADPAATSTESRVRAACRALASHHPELHWVPGLDGATLARLLGVSGPLGGIQPDGGLWCDAAGRPVLAVEAKKQGQTGNAIERWYKNWAVLDALGTARYLTVCCGEGFYAGRSAQRSLELAVSLAEPARRAPGAGPLWNRPAGRLWLYRYPVPPTAASCTRLVRRALDGLG